MNSPLTRGILAGLAAGTAIRRGEQESQDRARQDELNRRADQEYERQQEGQRAYEQLQRDRYEGTGDFAGPVVGGPSDPQAAQMADASYDRKEAVRMGVPMPEAQMPAGMPVGAGLSLTPAQVAGAQPQRQALSDADKDKLYYSKLQEWGAKYLDPSKAVAWKADVQKLQEMDYNRQRLEAFRLISSGKKEGLDAIARMYNDQLPDGWNMDTTNARFIPGEGWTGLRRVHESGAVEDLKGDNTTMAAMFMASDPAQLLQTRLALNKEGREAKADQRADAQLDYHIKSGDRAYALDLAKFSEQVAERIDRRNYQKASLANDSARLKLAGEELGLKKDIAAKEESAADIKNRQAVFAANFGANRKLGDMASEADKAAHEGAQLATSIATGLYQLNTAGVDPKERGKVAPKAELFARGYGELSLDAKKFKQGKDGIWEYEGLEIPAILAESYLAAVKPADEKPAKTPAKPGLRVPASQEPAVPGVDTAFSLGVSP